MDLTKIFLLVYTILVSTHLIWIIAGLRTGSRYYIEKHELNWSRIWAKAAIIFAIGLTYLSMPTWIAYVPLGIEPNSLKSIHVWVYLALGITLISAVAGEWIQSQNEIKNKLPTIVFGGLFAGFSHMIFIAVISSSLRSPEEVTYYLTFYAMMVGVYIIARRVFEINLIKISRGLAFDLRQSLVRKIYASTYQRFERIEKGKVYAVLNDDANVIAGGASIVANVALSAITILGSFIYMTILDFQITLLILMVLVVMAGIFYFVERKATHLFEKARDEGNTLMNLIDGMVHGAKELNLRMISRLRYKADILKSARKNRDLTIKASNRMLNADLLGDTLLLSLLALIVFGLPVFNASVETGFLASFLVVILYVLGPIQMILRSIPNLMQVGVSWRRVKAFTRELQDENPRLQPVASGDIEPVEELEVSEVYFNYEQDNPSEKSFGVGPINFKISVGEVAFVIGGNGSGKSTFAKLLSGLYRPDKGEILVNGKPIEGLELGRHFSAVFNPPYLFKKLYGLEEGNVDTEKAQELLDLFELPKRVTITKDKFNTVDLSSGQRKRLALVQCYLQDAPIFLFDEWAADQDPTYRRLFYTKLIPEMRAAGKMVITITHDDHYFHLADQVLEMRGGMLVEKLPEVIEA